MLSSWTDGLQHYFGELGTCEAPPEAGGHLYLYFEEMNPYADELV
jgi:hypothetical protein